jgi:lysyl-tRNA synthetase class I
VTTETVTTGDKTQTVTQSGDKDKTKQVPKKVEPKCPIEKKAGAPMEKTPEAAK